MAINFFRTIKNNIIEIKDLVMSFRPSTWSVLSLASFMFGAALIKSNSKSDAIETATFPYILAFGGLGLVWIVHQRYTGKGMMGTAGISLSLMGFYPFTIGLAGAVARETLPVELGLMLSGAVLSTIGATIYCCVPRSEETQSESEEDVSLRNVSTV